MYLLISLLRWLVLAMGSRFKDAMIPMTVGLFIIEQLCMTVAIEMLLPMTSSQMIHLIHIIWRQGTFFGLFMCPSLSYLAFYTVVIQINVIQATLRHFGTSDSQANRWLYETITICAGCATICWILQKRELRNFFT